MNASSSMCLYICQAETAPLPSTAVLRPVNCVASQSHIDTHRRAHTLAFPRALKTAVGPDPCHVSGASSAPQGKLKWRLASLAPLEKVLGSKSMWTSADCQISGVVRSSWYLVYTA